MFQKPGFIIIKQTISTWHWTNNNLTGDFSSHSGDIIRKVKRQYVVCLIVIILVKKGKFVDFISCIKRKQ